LRNAIETGLDRPVATGSSRSCTAARFAAAGRVVEVAAGLVVVVVLVVGAAEVGAVEVTVLGELSLLHAASVSTSAARDTTTGGGSFRIEARLGRGAAYASSP
jgi:hypothetical protein